MQSAMDSPVQPSTYPDTSITPIIIEDDIEPDVEIVGGYTTGPTSLQLAYRDNDRLDQLLSTFDYCRINCGIDPLGALRATIQTIPPNCDLIKAWMPQAEELTSRKVILILGTCRLRDNIPNLTDPSSLTEQLCSGIRAAAQACGYDAILVDLRKNCRRSRDDKFCAGFNKAETKQLVHATAIELRMLQDAYTFEVAGVVSFAEPWYKSYNELKAMKPFGKGDVPHMHIDEHLGHILHGQQLMAQRARKNLFTNRLRELSNRIAEELRDLSMGTGQEVYEAMYPTLKRYLDIHEPGTKIVYTNPTIVPVAATDVQHPPNMTMETFLAIHRILDGANSTAVKQEEQQNILDGANSTAVKQEEQQEDLQEQPEEQRSLDGRSRWTRIDDLHVCEMECFGCGNRLPARRRRRHSKTSQKHCICDRCYHLAYDKDRWAPFQQRLQRRLGH